ncbi:uncharacterized protein V1510DRAFT_430263 [Dipodascopsis tothii]|uniref:uncharacterized protein n=1 Tax=Dipodascopsis tothii TaxID=44089 RepID=UPI0034CEFED4
MSSPAAMIPPHTLRIKRKRNQDPLQALLLDPDEASKRTKTNAYVFRLAGTEDSIGTDDSAITLLEAPKPEAEQAEQAAAAVAVPTPAPVQTRTFRLPKRKRDESRSAASRTHAAGGVPGAAAGGAPAAVDDELQAMVEQYLQLNREAGAPLPARALKRAHHEPPSPGADAAVAAFAGDDYVYDIYHREKMQDVALASGQYGVVLVSPGDYEELVNDDSDDEPIRSDDEDSNAEDFYRNDYPDEDSADSIYQYGPSSGSSSESHGADDDEYDYGAGFQRFADDDGDGDGAPRVAPRVAPDADDFDVALNDDAYVHGDDLDDDSRYRTRPRLFGPESDAE